MAKLRDLAARATRDVIKATSRGEVGPHLTRFAMYQELPKLVTPSVGRHLSVSHSESLCEMLGLTGTVVAADYPEHNLLELGFADGSFSSIVSDQVLEHLEGDPQRAFDESARVVEPGGLVVHTTCFLNPIHLDPDDFWRFTPRALEFLAERAGLEVEHVGGWGNLAAVGRLQNYRLRFVPVPRASWHPWHRIAVRNEPNCPIMTWVVARRPR